MELLFFLPSGSEPLGILLRPGRSSFLSLNLEIVLCLTVPALARILLPVFLGLLTESQGSRQEDALELS